MDPLQEYKNLCRRSRPGDRRRRSSSFNPRYLLGGRRRSNRRAEDPQRNYYVDVYSAPLFAALVLIVVFSLVDALFTYTFVSRGGRELNPIMRILIDQGAQAFFPYKFILTAAGVLILCIHKNFVLVRGMISVVLLLYLLLTFYHVSLLHAF